MPTNTIPEKTDTEPLLPETLARPEQSDVETQTATMHDNLVLAELGLPEDFLPYIRKITSSPRTRIQVSPDQAEAVSITDHTLLGNKVTTAGLVDLCWESMIVDPIASSVCVQGEGNARQAKALLWAYARLLKTPTIPRVCAVGERHFPKTTLTPITESGVVIEDQLPGTAPLEAKLQDASEAIKYANIFDMVLDTKMLLEGDIDGCTNEVKKIRAELDKKDPTIELRVICSTGMLREIGGLTNFGGNPDKFVEMACKVINNAAEGRGKRSITMKTETGFIAKPNDPKGGKFGATMKDATLMSRTLSPHVGIKLSGGVSLNNAQEIMKAAKTYAPTRTLYIGASGLIGGFGKALLQRQQDQGAY
ncbi:hypothetical protein M0P48_03315 [Candidatus Gracilibacteria bacterium]|nr:hypothetical protein [Candidatus Gracilibacteria bacterium]